MVIFVDLSWEQNNLPFHQLTLRRFFTKFIFKPSTVIQWLKWRSTSGYDDLAVSKCHTPKGQGAFDTHSGPYGVGILVLDLGLVDSLKEKLLEKLEQFIVNLELDSREFLLLSVASEASTREFVEVVCAYWVIFPDSEQQLIKLAQNLLTRCYLLST
ncbi:hypothetical protein ACSBR2_040287 [Camellia fascicularis]